MTMQQQGCSRLLLESGKICIRFERGQLKAKTLIYVRLRFLYRQYTDLYLNTAYAVGRSVEI